MENYIRETKDIPWGSFGRRTVAFEVGRSLLPVGVQPEGRPTAAESDPGAAITNDDPKYIEYLMNIVGTAIQGGEGKLVTCAHVVEGVFEHQRTGYVLARVFMDERTMVLTHYRILKALRYIDPRSRQVNDTVDLAVLIVPAVDGPVASYDVPCVEWGDSTQLGVGDQVLVAGYPYGTQMFLANATNRGVIQPTVYPGIISAIVPAARDTETRLLQISAAVAGGISGGAVFHPNTGAVLGMITSGLEGPEGVLHPVTFAIPSEVIAPYVKAISFDAGGRRWGKQ